MIWSDIPSSVGEYTLIYGSTAGDYLRYICECGDTVTIPLHEVSGWSWPAESERPIMDNVSVSCPCGKSEVINGAG